MRVLVVSDDELERRRIVGAMSLVSAEVTEVDDVERMRVLLIEEPGTFDVVVVDGDLRPRGGYAALYDVRARAELDGFAVPVSVVVVEREQDRWLAAWAGANAVVFRPVDGFELSRRVREIRHEGLRPYGDRGSDAAQLAEATRGHQSA
ncbi:MAG: response regulator [Nitriliruptoraceae bacterium]